MDPTDTIYLRGLSLEQQMIFVTESGRQHKSETTAILFTLLLGGVGAHRFYLRQTGLGVVYLLFFWTFIPGIVAFFELFVISKRVRKYNDQVKKEIAATLRLAA